MAELSEERKPSPRAVRSFIRRQGRITVAQQQALDELWGDYGLDPQAPFDAAVVFGRRAPLVLEIGFGNGESLAQMAAERPEVDFVGIEVHRPGVGHLMLRLKERELDNVRIYAADALEVIERCFEEASLDGIHLFFPDPWPKKRHHKRRIVNPEFVALAASRLKPGGLFHAATDWKDYAVHMLAVLEASAALENVAGPGSFSPRPGERPVTKFERRGLRLGHGVWDLIYRRRA